MLVSLKSRVSGSLDDLGLDVRSLARAEGISPRTVRNVFDEIGTTPARYIRQARMTRAQRLLRSTNLRIADIAALTGFADHSTMTRVFRRDLGRSPRDYRDAYRTDDYGASLPEPGSKS
ncbi:MAG: AraC family transcriptional regulator [Microbacterium sp.]|nr:MAG: AraC family transcriptional regulator [Microbacterium sp.]